MFQNINIAAVDKTGYALGMESYDILDGQISSDDYSAAYRPWHARLNLITKLGVVQPWFDMKATTNWFRVSD